MYIVLVSQSSKTSNNLVILKSLALLSRVSFCMYLLADTYLWTNMFVQEQILCSRIDRVL